ncbi:MAG: hypothetical protein JSV33_13990 [bacterium]|nr:MAG: hypothetical protein JSV33_13990 [bacterium]
MKRMLSIAALIIAVFAAVVYGAIPRTLNYQGVLTDAGGTVVPDGTYSIVFSIYNVSSGGSSLWSETHGTVQVTKGIFNVILGSISPIPLDFDDQYYLGISVEGEAELSPRVQLTSSAYAFNSRGVMGTDNIFPPAGYVGIGTIAPSYPLAVYGTDPVGIQYNGSHLSWAGIYINATQASGQPIFGYSRGTLKASTYVDTSDRWHCNVNGENRLTITPGGNVGIGNTAPSVKLVVDGAIRIGSTPGNTTGMIRWTGADFEGYDGGTWHSLTSNGGSGSLPPGAAGQTLRHNGASWVANSFLYNNGSDIGIGTTTPSSELHIYKDENTTTSIELENPNTGANSTQRIDFADENGTLAGLVIFDDDNVAYPAEMHLFNNRPDGSLELSSGVGAVMIQNDGDVGVGVSDPNATLHVKGGNWDLDATNGDLKIGDDTYSLKIGVATGGGGAGTAGIRMQGGLGRIVLGGGANEVVAIESDGDVMLGSYWQTSTLSLYRSGISDYIAQMFSYGDGGAFFTYDEVGSPIFVMEPDFNGTGGWFNIKRSAAAYGFTVEGNYIGTEEPRVTITGSSQVAAFRMDQTDDNSLLLPISSVSSQELYNEPGAASNTEGGAVGFSLTGAVDVILSRSITVPEAGYVLVIASSQTRASHTNGAASSATFGVSDASDAFPENQDLAYTIPSTTASGMYDTPMTVSGLFVVASGGTYTYYYLGQESGGAYYVFDIQLTLIYIPTAYGTVAPTVVSGMIQGEETGGRSPMTQAEIAAERSESEQANMERMQRELDAMQAELEEIKQQLKNER